MNGGPRFPAALRLRRLAAISFAAMSVVGLAALPAGAAGGKKKPRPITVNLQSRSQAAVLGSGRVKFAVRARATGGVRLTASTISGGKTVQVVHSRRVHLKGGKKRRLVLKLTSRGRTNLAGCSASRLRVSVFAKHRTKKGKRVVASDTNAIKLDSQRCNLPAGVDLTNADRCDFITPAGSHCLMPWPDNYYTKPDPSTTTGLRLNLQLASTPANAAGIHVDPTDMNRSDGFSPGAPIVTRIPGLDTSAAMAQTGAVPLTKMSESFDANQPIVVIDASTGERQLIWSELDSNATTPGNTDLLIHPGKNFLEGHRYIVALRNLKDASGQTIPAPAGFRLYRDEIPTDKAVVEDRRSHFQDIFSRLQSAGIGRSDLYMAWDFTVASERNISESMLAIRNDAFSQLGDNNLSDGVTTGTVPSFSITDVKTDGDPVPANALTGDHTVQNAREVTGTFQVPCYLDDAGCAPGGKFKLGADGLPIRTPGNFQTARFTCNIPHSAVTSSGPGTYTVTNPARPSMYGHGLFGDFTEVHTADVRKLGTENNVVTCATDFTGMMEDDIPTAAVALSDLSKFSPIPDGLQQGFVDFMYLGRLLKSPNGFTTSPAFQFDGGTSVLAPNQLYYYGNSQGGIAGGALTAVEPDLTRSVLYVPGMNYSTLLTRSVDFGDYAQILYPSYPDEQVRPLLLSMIQMEWDRGEPDGYAQHMTSDPLPDTPAHHVLLEMAYGDHQVANVTTQVEARTIGAPLRQPALDTNRLPSGFDEPFYGQDTLGSLSGPAADGNGMFIWDIGPKRMDPTLHGTDPPPITNTAPNDSFGIDPHDTVIRASNLIRAQIADFLKVNGKITDPCGLTPCYAAGWNGFP